VHVLLHRSMHQVRGEEVSFPCVRSQCVLIDSAIRVAPRGRRNGRISLDLNNQEAAIRRKGFKRVSVSDGMMTPTAICIVSFAGQR
jgi:hypothetical protein